MGNYQEKPKRKEFLRKLRNSEDERPSFIIYQM